MDNLQRQRLELKYIVSEETAVAARDFVSAYLTLDKFGTGRPDFSYPIHSLYLDSDDLALYWHTINGNKNRYKLRLRYYSDKSGAPVFCEIKRRVNGAILKQRGAIKRSAVEGLLNGQLPGAEQLISDDPGQTLAVERFCELMQHNHAKPKAHVAYRREAWASSGGNMTRVTMDRQIQFEFRPATLLRAEMQCPLEVFPGRVVLELKFTGRFPDWFGELARCFNLWQCAAAKYADGVALLMESGRERLIPAAAPSSQTVERLHRRRSKWERHCLTNELIATT